MLCITAVAFERASFLLKKLIFDFWILLASAVFRDDKRYVQKCEEYECYRNKRNKVDKPAIVEVENGKILHRRSHKVEEVGVICLECAINPQHDEHYAEKIEHIVLVGLKSEGCLLADKEI